MKIQTSLYFMRYIIFVAAILSGCPTRGATLLVSDAADAAPNSLRTAIAQANLDPPGDVIVFAQNLSVITINFGEMIIHQDITISGPGATNLTIIGASPHDRVFEIQKNNNVGVTVSISRLRFSGGYRALDGQPGTQANQDQDGKGGMAAAGGIIYNNGGCSLLVTNCVFEQCYAVGGDGGNGFGGVIAPPGAGGPGGDARGGAIWTAGLCNVYGSTFRSNSATGGNGGAGTNASSSFPGSGGGLGGTGFGGAVYVDYSGAPAFTPVNSTFSLNMANGGNGGRGGDGIFGLAGGPGGNGGNAEGGVVYHANLNCGQGDCGRMVHCTLSQNFLRRGSGASGGAGNPPGAPGTDGTGAGGGLWLAPVFYEIGNSIISGNGCLGSGVCGGPEVKGTVVSLSYNLLGALDGNSMGWTPLDAAGTMAIPLDARLGSLQDNGGETPTMAPLVGSPAIDMGGPSPYGLDQASQVRPVITVGVFNGGDGSDVGAFEVQCSLQIPSLTLAHSGQNLLLAWPWPSRCYILQQTADLGMPNWITSPYMVNVVGNQNQVLVPAQAGNLFFRLKK
jgi:hypothetical protein